MILSRVSMLNGVFVDDMNALLYLEPHHHTQQWGKAHIRFDNHLKAQLHTYTPLMIQIVAEAPHEEDEQVKIRQILGAQIVKSDRTKHREDSLRCIEGVMEVVVWHMLLIVLLNGKQEVDERLLWNLEAIKQAGSFEHDHSQPDELVNNRARTVELLMSITRK